MFIPITTKIIQQHTHTLEVSPDGQPLHKAIEKCIGAMAAECVDNGGVMYSVEVSLEGFDPHDFVHRRQQLKTKPTESR